MKKFVFKSLILLSILWASDLIIGSILENLYFKSTNGSLKALTYEFSLLDKEILIFGSSRANHHYNSSLFERKLESSCYNSGKDGQGVFYSYALLKSTTIRYRPKLIICDVSPNIFLDKHQLEKLSILLPFYDKIPPIQEVIQLRGPMEKIKLLSRIYRYNSEIYNILFHKNKDPYLKGYDPLEGNLDSTNFIEREEDFSVCDNLSLNIFESFCKEAKKFGISLIVTVSPMYSKDDKKNEVINKLKSITNKHRVIFWDYSLDKRFNNKAYLFRDQLHLNHLGANFFSDILIKRIKDENILK